VGDVPHAIEVSLRALPSFFRDVTHKTTTGLVQSLPRRSLALRATK